MDILGIIAIYIMGAIAFDFGNDNDSVVIKLFGILLKIIALTYIFYKFIFAKGG